MSYLLAMFEKDREFAFLLLSANSCFLGLGILSGPFFASRRAYWKNGPLKILRVNEADWSKGSGPRAKI